jgi:hypothetical protein
MVGSWWKIQGGRTVDRDATVTSVNTPDESASERALGAGLEERLTGAAVGCGRQRTHRLMAHSEEQRTAIHEAGHAVAAYTLGWAFTSVSIAPDDDTRR